jgi:hypothetical protein
MLSAADRGILLTAGDAADQSENSGASRRFEQAQISDAYGWSEVVLEVLGPG